ncbi:NAD(+) diphosphatase [Jiella sonneratiae]|uniref:NAD(+) diphosphatase n=1 Tax=Jiella sonneratiae TaxID=2816856 RepID=A0ABS3J4V9_9HYPH|nr:NAD(+) diphosphatase [Jiella sonneratiae]MBO0904692.1 NAD(+) diphosphatase [Jiella sonneratiae]
MADTDGTDGTDGTSGTEGPDARPEMSARMGFSRNRLRRDGELRTGESLAAALADAAATIYLGGAGKWLVKTDGPELSAAFGIEEARLLGADLEAAILLGFDPAGGPALSAVVALPEEDAAGLAAMDLRGIGMEERLDPDTEGRLAQAAHLLQWHGKNRFCGVCGAATRSAAAGYRRECTACDNVVFPRTDPVTIMLVHDGEGRCVLGRQPRFAANFWSCLAGFVEPGETLEDAVRRETMEEAGLAVGEVTLLASQPWPFPGNLMIGCLAKAETRQIVFDATELEACRWFPREEVRAMLEGRHPDGLAIPKRFAIAHHLIRAFVEAPAGTDR